MKTYNILLIDDEKEVCESLIDFASQFGIAKFDADIIITDRQNWQDGAELLEKEYFHALILDARCMIDRDQTDDNFDFLTIALERLKEIEQKQDRHIPFVINTGYFGEKEVQMMQRLISERKGRIFSKTLPKDEMFQYLVAEIENSENTKIEKEYSDVFEVFDKGYLDSKFRIELLKILKTRNDDAKNQENLRAVRVIQDEIYNSLNRKNSGIVPTGSFTNKNKHLSGNTDQNHSPTTTVFQTNTISFLANMIYRISSEFGNHPPQKPTKVTVEYWEMPSKYAVKSLIFALLEQLLWFKNLMEKP
jgi:CheY-like chemotaxis protein